MEQEAGDPGLEAGSGLEERMVLGRCSGPDWEDQRKAAALCQGRVEMVEAELEAVKSLETLVHLLASPEKPASKLEAPVASPGEPARGSSFLPYHRQSPLVVLEPALLV